MKRRHLLYLGLLVAVLVAAGCSAPATPVPTPVPAADTPAPPPTATTAAATSVPIEGDMPVGLTEYGAPYRGDPNAPVTLLEYSDFL